MLVSYNHSFHPFLFQQVSVNGELVKSVNLFSDELTLSELKVCGTHVSFYKTLLQGHRSVAVRAIDHKLGGTREGRIHERKVTKCKIYNYTLALCVCLGCFAGTRG